jgi:hypothetical protein
MIAVKIPRIVKLMIQIKLNLRTFMVPEKRRHAPAGFG